MEDICTWNKAHCALAKQIIFTVIMLTRSIYKIYNFDLYFELDTTRERRENRECVREKGREGKSKSEASKRIRQRGESHISWTLFSRFRNGTCDDRARAIPFPPVCSKRIHYKYKIIRFGECLYRCDGNVWVCMKVLVEIVFRKKSFIVWNLAIYFRPHIKPHIFMLLLLLFSTFGCALGNACTPLYIV